MAQIIVTASDPTQNIRYDVEVPNDLEIAKLTDDLIQAFMGADPYSFWKTFDVRLKSSRLNRVLSQDNTLASEGVLNGDCILICEKDRSLIDYGTADDFEA